VGPAAAGDLQRFTDRTLIETDALEREADEVRARGYARNRDEWIPGLSVIAAPVRLGDRLVAAVALAAPSARMEELGEWALADRVCAAALRVSQRLSGTHLDR
jgi:DNA-binding IclR family transcriptional regulator